MVFIRADVGHVATAIHRSDAFLIIAIVLTRSQSDQIACASNGDGTRLASGHIATAIHLANLHITSTHS